MIKFSKNKDKRSDIYRIFFVYTWQAEIKNYPGSDIYIKADQWNEIKYSSVTFQEKDEINGEPVEQELNINIHGSNDESAQIIRDVCGRELLIRLDYSNGETKIIGTDDNPVMLSCTSSGSPITQNLFSKRSSAEKSKRLKSF